MYVKSLCLVVLTMMKYHIIFSDEVIKYHNTKDKSQKLDCPL